MKQPSENNPSIVQSHLQTKVIFLGSLNNKYEYIFL